MPGGAELSRKRLDDLTDKAKQLGRQGPGVDAGHRRRARQPGRQVPLRRRAGRHPRRGSRPRPATCVLLVADERPVVRHVLGLLRLELGPPAGDRGRPALPVGRRLPAVRGARRRRQPGARPPPVHDAAPRRRRPAVLRRPGRPAAGAVAGLRPGAQRVGAGLGLGPDPPLRRAADASSACSASARRRRRPSSGSCSTPSATARRRTPASPSASTGWSRCWWARRTSARSSPSPRPSRAPTR